MATPATAAAGAAAVGTRKVAHGTGFLLLLLSLLCSSSSSVVKAAIVARWNDGDGGGDGGCGLWREGGREGGWEGAQEDAICIRHFISLVPPTTVEHGFLLIGKSSGEQTLHAALRME